MGPDHASSKAQGILKELQQQGHLQQFPKNTKRAAGTPRQMYHVVLSAFKIRSGSLGLDYGLGGQGADCEDYMNAIETRTLRVQGPK